MKMGNKGQGMFMAMFVAMAAVVIGGVFLLGSIGNLLKYVVEHFFTIVLAVFGIGITFGIIANFAQKKPHWKKDLIGMAAIVGLFLVLIFFPSVTSQIYGWKVDMDVNVLYPAFAPVGGIELGAVNIKEETFKKTGPLTLIQPRRLGVVQVGYEGHITVKCNGEEVDKADFAGTIIRGFPANLHTVTLNKLPGGSTCSANVKLIDTDTNQVVDEKTKTFSVPKAK